MDNFNNELFDELCHAMSLLKGADECRMFLEDICSIKELEAISQRLKVAALLKSGCNYQDIIAKTGASTATISRVNKCLRFGSGGYELVLGGKDK
ncbi:MAG: hypothetical protein IJX38_03470 [Clostridia bacterium]|nr:hypothetical protein [Clostridia bacterium]